MKIEDFDYDLPPERIAQTPLARGDSRLLVVPAEGSARHRRVKDLASLLEPGDLVVLNDTRVLPARLHGRSDTGGKIELLLAEKIGDATWLAMAKPGKKARPGRRFDFSSESVELSATATGKKGDLYRFEFDRPVESVLDQLGEMPLPPYIRRGDDAVDIPSNIPIDDRESYQTVFAREPGAVAAPTAGLHFSQDSLDQLESLGIARATITLHVGLGTFKPVTAERIEDHIMHSERYSIPARTTEAIRQTKNGGGNVVAIGTTVVRCLEAAARANQGQLPDRVSDERTDLFLTPGDDFLVVDRLLTNFHLPRSTLLMLVCAFGGSEKTLSAYREAIENHYRFYSYGDAMLIDRRYRSSEGLDGTTTAGRAISGR